MPQKRVYALWHNKEKMEIRIESREHWKREAQKIAHSDEPVVYHNSNYFLSFSRAALVRKAKEIRNEWVREHEKAIEQIFEIVIK